VGRALRLAAGLFIAPRKFSDAKSEELIRRLRGSTELAEVRFSQVKLWAATKSSTFRFFYGNLRNLRIKLH